MLSLLTCPEYTVACNEVENSNPVSILDAKQRAVNHSRAKRALCM